MAFVLLDFNEILHYMENATRFLNEGNYKLSVKYLDSADALLEDRSNYYNKKNNYFTPQRDISSKWLGEVSPEMRDFIFHIEYKIQIIRLLAEIFENKGLHKEAVLKCFMGLDMAETLRNYPISYSFLETVSGLYMILRKVYEKRGDEKIYKVCTEIIKEITANMYKKKRAFPVFDKSIFST